LHFGSARWQRTADKHLQDFLGSGAIDKPVELVAPLLRKAQNRDAAWHRTPLYSSQEFGPTRSPSSTFYKRHKELPRSQPHAYKPLVYPIGSVVRYEKTSSKLDAESPSTGIVRRSPTKQLDDNTIGDGRIFSPLQPHTMKQLGYHTAHLHVQPGVQDEGLIPRRPEGGYKVIMNNAVIETSSPIPEAHYANPNPSGDPPSVFNPDVLGGCSWPIGRREVLRSSASFVKADPFELFPHEYAQCGNAGQGNTPGQYQKGQALHPNSCSSNTAAEYADQGDIPAWQVAKGVYYNRYRRTNTPYRSIRPRPLPEDIAREKNEAKKKEKHTLRAQLDWIQDGERRFKLDKKDTSTIPRELRENNPLEEVCSPKSSKSPKSKGDPNE